MWTVISKTRKAIPGLAKILLALFLLGSIGFAVYVQHLKQSFLKLEPDTPLEIRTDAGIIKLMLSSRWEKITESESNIGRTGIWSIPGNSKDTTSGFFYLNLTQAQLMPETQFAFIARQNSWLGHLRLLKIAQNTESNIAFPNYEVLAGYMDSRREMILVTRMIYLPGGMTLSMTFITSYSDPIRSDYWLEELAQKVQFVPSDQLHQVRENQSRKINLAGVPLVIPGELWVLSEAGGGSLSLQPEGKSETDRWQARIKPMRLPAYRKPKAILHDLFFDPFDSDQRISFSEPSRTGSFILYQASLDEPQKAEDAPYRTQQYAWLLHRADGLALLTTLETTAASKKKAQETLRKILLGINAPALTPTTQPALKTFLTPAAIANQADDITGWFLVSQNDIRIGFEAILVSAMPGVTQPDLKVISYSFFDTDAVRYQEDSRWQIKTDLSQANSESHIKTQLEQNGRPIQHVLISLSEVTPSELQLNVKLNKDIATEKLQRPGDFLPGSSEQMLINLMGRSDWTGPDTITFSQFSDFQPQLEIIQVRRGKTADGRRCVFVSTDFQTNFTTHLFDEKGRWLSQYNSNGFSISRSSPEEIKRLYPRLFTLAEQRLGTLAGGERPDREKE